MSKHPLFYAWFPTKVRIPKSKLTKYIWLQYYCIEFYNDKIIKKQITNDT